MSAPAWSAVDDYIVDQLIGADAVLAAALAHNRRAGLPPIDVSPAQGKLLQLLAKGIGATRILEIGTLGGYSTIWLARALGAGGRVAGVLGRSLVLLATLMVSGGQGLLAAVRAGMTSPDPLGRLAGYGWVIGDLGGLLTRGLCII